MDARSKMPVVGEFEAAGGFKVAVHAATLRQSLDLQSANGSGDSTKALEALVAFVGALAEVEGVEDPASVLTSADCERIIRLASSGGGADFR